MVELNMKGHAIEGVSEKVYKELRFYLLTDFEQRTGMVIF